jgi:peptide/nickel transport system permease protein
MPTVLASSSPSHPSPAVPGPQPAQRSRGYWASVWLRLRRDPVAVGAAVVVLLLIGLALFGPWIAPSDPYQASMLKRLKPIGTEGLPLGSDELGRDMLSRLIVGARLSLFIGITPVLCAFVLGTVIGIVAGYAGGITNTLVMRTVDVFYAFPRCCWPLRCRARWARAWSIR